MRDNRLAEARGLSSRTGAQTVVYPARNYFRNRINATVLLFVYGKYHFFCQIPSGHTDVASTSIGSYLSTICPLGYIECKPGRVAQSVGHPTHKSGVLGSIPGLATYFRFSFRFFKKGSCQLLAKVCARSTG